MKECFKIQHYKKQPTEETPPPPKKERKTNIRKWYNPLCWRIACTDYGEFHLRGGHQDQSMMKDKKIER